MEREVNFLSKKSYIDQGCYFLFTLFKIPKMVCKEFNKIQHHFLWGWSSDRKKIVWVSWRIVTKSKDTGRLGIKDLESFNVALLGKWKWRLGMVEKGLWSEIIKVWVKEIIGI